MKNQKTKKIFSIVSFCLVAIMSVSLIGTLFAGSSFGGDTSSNKKPSNTVTPSTNTIFGVSWDRTESTALNRLTTYNDFFVTTNITEEPVAGVGNTAGSSQFDNYYPWNAMKEYNVIDNKIAYSSDDEEFSRTEYDTVVYIPTFYYRVVDDGTSRKYYISAEAFPGFAVHPGSNNYVGKYSVSSDYTSVSGSEPVTAVTRADIRVNAMAKGENWSQFDYATWNAIQLLYLVEYADFDSQAKIGRGMVDSTALGFARAPQNTGGCDTMVYHTGRAEGPEGYSQIQYRYIEGLWGNCCEWVDGINSYDGNIFISTDYKSYADDTEVGYTFSGVILPATGHIKDVGHSTVFSWAFIPSESIATTDYSVPMYVPDKVCNGSGWRVLYTSNNADGDSLAGLFRFSMSSQSDRIESSFGGRLVFHGE